MSSDNRAGDKKIGDNNDADGKSVIGRRAALAGVGAAASLPLMGSRARAADPIVIG